MLVNGWHSDKTGERRWHTALPLISAGVIYLLVVLTHSFPFAMALLIVAGGCMLAYYPVFWSMPTMFLSETAAAACFGLINSVGHIGGFIGPTAVGYLNDRTRGMAAAFLFIGMCQLLAGGIFSAIRISSPERSAAPVVVREPRLQETSQNTA